MKADVWFRSDSIKDKSFVSFYCSIEMIMDIFVVAFNMILVFGLYILILTVHPMSFALWLAVILGSLAPSYGECNRVQISVAVHGILQTARLTTE